MTYRESVHRLYALGNELPSGGKPVKFGLQNITRVLNALGNPHRIPKFIHVAGTNGKGSTCAMIEAGLRAAGIRTGLYTSPHLLEPTERIQLAGAPISQEEFSLLFEEVAAIELTTYFETVTAMAFLAFSRNADIVVLETGLGGRLDATNVVTPILSVITPVDFDHQIYLGNTLTEIAGEKAGILKPNVPAVIATQHPEAMRVFEHHAPLTRTDSYPVADLRLTSRNSAFTAGGLAIVCPLAGAHQVENARTAAVSLHQLGFGVEGIANAHWPGRLQHLSETLIVDGAHNPAGAHALAAYIRRFYSGRKLRLIFGAMRDKAVAEMAQMLFPLFDEIILTAPNHPRSMPPSEIALLTGYSSVIAASVEDALAIPHKEITFASGSLFLVAEVIQLRNTMKN